MQKIPLELARPDMTLAKAVLRENGMVLVAEGTALTQALLDRLTAMHVEHVVVEGSPVDLGAAGGMSYAQRLEHLDHLFRKHEADPWMVKVKAFILGRFTLQAAAQAAPSPAAPPAGEEPGGATP